MGYMEKIIKSCTLEEFKKLDLSQYKTDKCLTKKKGRKTYEYLPQFGTIDTEVSTISYNLDDGRRSGCGLLYIWQACIDGHFVYGRTIEEFFELCRHLYLTLGLSYKKRLVIYCHNLEYDWQFLRSAFNRTECFATQKRAILYAYAYGIEFRCSYKWSNMSLAKLTEAMNVTHKKQSGEDFDYSKIRTPKTVIGSNDFTEDDFYYCYCDVLGLWEAINAKMELDGDDIVSIPLTSTGYVRRDCRKAMATNEENRKLFEKTALNEHTYKLCKQAFRGGNTHANRHYAGQIIKNVMSYDLASSYPSVIEYAKFACTPYMPIDLTEENLAEYLNTECALLVDVTFVDIHTDAVVPYIPADKCMLLDTGKYKKDVFDNGRVLKARTLRTVVTDDDLYIILKQYEYKYMIINEAYCADVAPLPKELREVVSKYYVGKTELKGVKGQEYYYAKLKNLLNACFGMCVQDPINSPITDEITEEGVIDWQEKDREELDIADLLGKFYNSRNSFLAYQWGVQITAKARVRLQEAIDICGSQLIYVDTDSVKFKANKNIAKKLDAINARIESQANNTDTQCIAYTKDGEKQVMGIWDNETKKYEGGVYEKFRTYGAKKYAVEYTKDGKHIFELTVAGLNKDLGSEYYGCIDNFVIGNGAVPEDKSGRSIVIYDDNVNPHFICYKGEAYQIKSNIAILPTTYRLGVTDEYVQIAENIFEGII